MSEKFSEEKALFFEYLEKYLTKRDLESLRTMFSPDFTGFGTGIDERGTDFEKSMELYKRDIENIPTPIDYEIKSLQINKPAENVFIVWSELNIKAFVSNHEFKFFNLRLSLVWVKREDKWLIEHMHISFPTETHEEGEAYPIKEIEDRNIVLQRLLSEKTEDLKRSLAEIRKQAINDRLTGIFNRIKIEEVIREEIERAKRYRTKFSIILFDIDHFKKVNDEFGHMVGDKFLLELAKLISKKIRKTDYFGRWGGEEFIVVSPNTTIKRAILLAEKLREATESHEFNTVGHKTASFGVAAFRAKDTSESLINRADIALYRAKEEGRNRVCFL